MSSTDKTSTASFSRETSIKVVRFNLYPKTDPTFRVVAFEVRCLRNDRTKYFETTVPLEDTRDVQEEEEAVVKLAWQNLKPLARAWFEKEAVTKDNILGSTFQDDDSADDGDEVE
jgi:hypothetical protein